jgi:hypothetical protein
MTKLTNIFAALAPLHGRALAATAPLRRVVSVPRLSLSRSPLRCNWVKDAAGHLVCAWTDGVRADASQSDDQSINRRGFGCAGLRLAV